MSWLAAPGPRMLGLAASLTAGCVGSSGENVRGNRDTGTRDGDFSTDGPGSAADSSGSGSSSPADSSSSGGGDAGWSSVTDSGASSGRDPGSPPSSCAPGGAGMTDCGGESCCASLEVTGGAYDRTYTNSGAGPTGEADPAMVRTFRLDKYEVTVGRFRQFVNAWDGGAGYLPPAGSGKHAHLRAGQGLVSSDDDAGVAYETGWAESDDGQIAPTSANLACEAQFATWTPSPGGQENLPINCVNWYEAYAFCAWDGGFLPSEAEWEYAAAGGSEQREYPWGATEPGTTSLYAIYDCNYPSGSGRCTGGAAPVGTAALGAGLWGQLDLAGNVSEWNLDGYGSYRAPCSDCAYVTAASYRVIRGGYFYNYASYLLPQSRSDDPPSARSICIGFRCARSVLN